MALCLFEHNARAYRRAAAMLDACGKAAVIHPTGTGKSYIAFKLIEEHPAARVLWLSPSEYIIKTQLEHLRNSDPCFPMGNVTFLTYARLMLLSGQELSALAPDYVIFDEFHRCGAEHWGDGVQRLLAASPGAGMLGLSATHIRYLDGQRDMAQELFDGHIASEMTLGEAVVRGILAAPVYVTTVYKYQQELVRCQKRVDGMKSSALRAESQKTLDALRRALEQADGLDKVFSKYVTNSGGKYIVFCSDYENLQEMRGRAGEWFGAVNPELHLYSAYSADTETSKAFAAFKQDDSGALKLLFCIDMLNEGVHVDGISGVILFRPTVSPIIYKQQIGRALTAGGAGTPLILDVVNNFENLCSISAVQQEMDAAVQRLRQSGEADKIVTERFTVIEQAHDSRRLFEQLDRSLAGTWDQYFHAASLYFAEHGHLNVPKRYVTDAGLSLGAWLMTQRKVRKGQCPGRLTEQQIERLDGIGMVWENRMELAWERGFAHAQSYYETYGDLLVPSQYRCADGYALGVWISGQRQKRASLPDQAAARLEAIGMQWSALDLQWERNYLAAAEYYDREGDLLVPAEYRTAQGLGLGGWVRGQRSLYRQGRLTPEQCRRLEAIGMQWGSSYDNAWQKGYAAAKRYWEKQGNLDVPPGYKMPDGFALGKWLERQRYAYRCPEKSNSVMTPERKAQLDELGILWEKPSAWEHKWALAAQYKQENGNLDIPAQYKTSDGIWLGRWVYEQKRLVAGSGTGRPLAPEQKRKLAELGIA